MCGPPGLLRQPHPRQRALGQMPRFSRRVGQIAETKFNILQRAAPWEQVKLLEYHAHAQLAQFRAGAFGQRGNFLTIKPHAPGVHRLQKARNHQKSGFAGAGRPGNHAKRARRQFHIHVPQHRHHAVGRRKGFVHVLQAQNRLIGIAHGRFPAKSVCF